MHSGQVRRLFLAILSLICFSPPLSADPGPGDVFREYLWKGPWINASGWQRVTDPGVTRSDAKQFLPNPVNRIAIDDLNGVVRAEIYIEMWGGHAGTSDKRLRLNGRDWISIPEPLAIPGDAGRAPIDDPQCYQYFTYPSVAVPLEDLLEGENTFEFTAGGQTCFNFGWGQWGAYGVTFRMYYDRGIAHPTGHITAPAVGSAIGDSVYLEAVALSPNGEIDQVDFIGHYEDFDYEGNGIYRQWHYRYRYGLIRNHLGTAVEAPYSATWNTTWVPDQDAPIRVVARLRDTTGLYYMTEAVDGLVLERPDRSVKLYKPFGVPGSWQTRAGRTHKANVFVGEDLSKAQAAHMVLTTWSGGHASAIGINDSSVVSRVGLTHNYSFDAVPVPLEYIRPGTNELFTFATTAHHGIEVLWPGIALMMQYEGLEERAPATADLLILAESLAPHWNLQGPDDTSAELISNADAFAGEKVLAVQPSKRSPFFLDLFPPFPLALAGYQSLRFAFHPDAAQFAGRTSLKLHVNDRSVELLDEEFGLDLERREWQIVEIPLEMLSLRFPYVETLRFEGRLQGTFLLDDMRLVASPPSTAIVDQHSVAPQDFSLMQNYPNPFNGTTTFRFILPQSAEVELSVYNLVGQKVATLLRGYHPAAVHALSWNGRDTRGRILASGVYIYRLQSSDGVESRRLVLLR